MKILCPLILHTFERLKPIPISAMKKQTRIIAITFLTFGLYFVLDELYFGAARKWIDGAIGQLGVSHLAAYLLFGIPIYLGALLLHGFKGFLESLGLNKPLLPGMLAPLLFTLPMFIGFALAFEFNAEITLNQVLIMVISAAFFEELFFRGFLFGQIYRYTRIGFIPAILLGALLFAAVHLYQSQDFPTLIGIFATTFLGAVSVCGVEFQPLDPRLFAPFYEFVLAHVLRCR
jgi:uncharacterized protein